MAIKLLIEVYPLELPMRDTNAVLHESTVAAPVDRDSDVDMDEDDEDASAWAGPAKRRRQMNEQLRSTRRAGDYHNPKERRAYVLKQLDSLCDAIQDDDEACRVAACEVTKLFETEGFDVPCTA
jgi:hypothetical protein